MIKHADQADFAKWESKAKGMSKEALQYSARDCREAAKSMKGFDAIAEGRYSDEAATYEREAINRKGVEEITPPRCYLSYSEGEWCVIHGEQAVSAPTKDKQHATTCGARVGASAEVYWNGDKGEFVKF